MSEKEPTKDEPRLCLSRRQFLLSGGAVVLSTVPGLAAPLQLQKRDYPRKKITTLAQLKQDVPVMFQYPDDAPTSMSFVVKLGVAAGGGIGPQKDIVAFNYLCTHMGGPLVGTYKKQYKAIGPCPLHLTTFDLLKHGMVIAGHATQSLPQVVLELDGDAIVAKGMMGLIYGRNSNI